MGGQGGEVWLETVRKYEKINSVLISCGGIWLQFFFSFWWFCLPLYFSTVSYFYKQENVYMRFYMFMYNYIPLLTLAAVHIYEWCKLGYILIPKLLSDTKLSQVTPRSYGIKPGLRFSFQCKCYPTGKFFSMHPLSNLLQPRHQSPSH